MLLNQEQLIPSKIWMEVDNNNNFQIREDLIKSLILGVLKRMQQKMENKQIAKFACRACRPGWKVCGIYLLYPKSPYADEMKLVYLVVHCVKTMRWLWPSAIAPELKHIALQEPSTSYTPRQLLTLYKGFLSVR
jgi:hypothetical protein